MDEKLYPKDKYSNGHPNLAISLTNLGQLLYVIGSYAQAQGYVECALAMYEKLYPLDKYPDGHPDLAHILNSLGRPLPNARGSHSPAEDLI